MNERSNVRFNYAWEHHRGGVLLASGDFDNLVTNEGGNDFLTLYLKNGTTATNWFLGLISSVSFTVVAVGDTAIQINGTNAWKECDATSAPNYSGTNRLTLVFGTAAAKSLAATGRVFTFTGAGTVKGAFISSAQAKSATTGKLFSAGLLSSGDRAVLVSDTLTVTATITV